MTKNDELYLAESFRYPVERWQWELPSGGIEPELSPLEAAKHELAEKLGITAKAWTKLGVFGPSHNSYLDDMEDVFVAQDLTLGPVNREPGEAIRAAKAIPYGEVLQMIRDGRLVDGQTLAALMQFVAWREKT